MNQPNFTICFGIGNISDFKKAFQLNTVIQLKESNSFVFPKERTLITPFFDNRNMISDRISKTVKTIKEYIH